ncbi:MAG TPA: homocysteine S-methyltransferase family protein, partial [Bryobacteraceae bacterium]|nr:homocysteine S-methyltransferase family protein [Bryobacteraceae bacterium]
MTDRTERTRALREALASRILVLDGAMGSVLHQRCTIHDFGGAGFDNCSENVLLERPDVIDEIHRGYLEAGADIIETNTFGGTRLVLDDFHIGDKVHEINVRAARLARDAAARYSTPERPRFVAGSMGPTTKSLSVTGGVTFQQLADNYYEQARALLEGGVDFLLIETAMDTGNVKAALIGIDRLERELGYKLLVSVSCTIYDWGGMLAGQPVDAFYASVSHRDLLSVGLNCATGPEFMTDHIRTLHQLASTYISCYPNAGLPNAEGRYDETPESLAKQLERFVEHGWLNIVGGCCGTTPEHIRALAHMVEGRKPREVPPKKRRSWYAGVELVEAEVSNRPLIVGERTNVIGSRAFRNLIAEEKWEEATEIARRQVRNGAHIVDVCLQSTDRDELKD